MISIFYTQLSSVASGKSFFSRFAGPIDKRVESVKIKTVEKMKKRSFMFLIIAGALLTGCGRYNVDFPPPSDFAGITDLFPERIDGEPMLATVSGLDQGVAYAYKGIGSIWVYRADSDESAAAYFDNNILPMLEESSSVRRWNINGKRQVQVKSRDGHTVGWTNGKWLFLIRSSGKTGLKKMIKAYPWIED